MLSAEERAERRAQMAMPTFDGVVRTKEAEDRINQTVRAALSGPNGAALMEYLKSITTSFVVPPSASDAELRHHEGKRHLVQILDARLKSTPNE